MRVPGCGWRRDGHDWHRTEVPLEPGLTAELDLTVAEADTARTMCSGDVDVLGTPRILALIEEATVQAVSGRLEDGETTVGTRVELSHLAPIAIGSKVRAEVTLEKVEGRRLIFTASVSDEVGLVAAGKIHRAVVQVEPFMEKAR
ncbi:MAG: fluoroacetyl-CoA thioesterase [Actinomycetota bacterium]|jgi:predicted thioesterase